MPSLGIGETLRRERERQGISLDDIARNTRIPRRHLDAIESEDFAGLPGLVFTRNFVRQYALALKLDAESIVRGLPKLDESMIQLPEPPVNPRKRARYPRPGSGHAWLVWGSLAIVAGFVLYTHFHPIPAIRAEIAALRNGRTTEVEAASVPVSSLAQPQPSVTLPASAAAKATDFKRAASVQVVITALQEAWVELSADGKPAFTGVLMPNERKEISAAQQVKLVAGNAGGLTVLLNGKPLEPLGPVGQVRVVRLTAEGPQFLQTSQPPSPDPDPL